jgi:predicted RNA-binding protein with PIN domain
VAEPTLYLFDGYNVLRASGITEPAELVDRLASFIALRGVRGVVVFDGPGTDREFGSLSVRYAPDADSVLERLAAEHRDTEQVLLVSSDLAVRGTSGQEVMKVTSKLFAAELGDFLTGASKPQPSRIADRLDEETRALLERLRRSRE